MVIEKETKIRDEDRESAITKRKTELIQ